MPLRYWSVLGILVSPAFAHAANAGAQQGPAAQALVLAGVTVVDVERGKLVPKQRVLVTGDRIRAVGRAGAVAIPPGARVIDARGKYLIPGLWDAHVHPQTNLDVAYPMFIVNGVTGIRDAGSGVPLDTLRQRRREILAGTRIGPPRQLLSGQSISGPKPRCSRRELRDFPQTCVTDSVDAKHLLDSLKTAGIDMLKPRGLTAALYFSLAAAAREAGIPFGGHVDEVSIIDASDSGASLIDHSQLDWAAMGYGAALSATELRVGASGLYARCARLSSATAARCRPLAERLRRNGTWYVPTLVAHEGLGLDGGGGPRATAIFERLFPALDGFWADSAHATNWLRAGIGPDTARLPDHAIADSSRGSMRILQAVDFPIVAGTDATNDNRKWGFALHAELAMYVASGLTPLQALQSATLNPAKMLRATDSLGTVAPGKLADLVLLDANPLADITNTTTIRAVVANGRYYDRAALDQLLTEFRARVTCGVCGPE